MTEQTVCELCGQPGKYQQGNTLLSYLADPEVLGPNGRERAMEALRTTTCHFPCYHARVEQLVGRPVWTHEIGLNWPGLVKEARWEDRPATMEEIIDLIPEEKRIIVTLPED